MLIKRKRENKINSIIKEVSKRNLLKRYFWLLVGCFIFAFGFNIFFLQYDLVCTGISGLSIVLQNYVEPSKLILVINIL